MSSIHCMHTWSFAQTKLVLFPDQAPKKSELSWLQYTNIRRVEAFTYQKELRGTKGLGSNQVPRICDKTRCMSCAQTKLVSFPDQAPKKSECPFQLSWLQYTNIRRVEAFAYQKELRGTKGLGSKTTFKYPESVIKQGVCETYDVVCTSDSEA